MPIDGMALNSANEACVPRVPGIVLIRNMGFRASRRREPDVGFLELMKQVTQLNAPLADEMVAAASPLKWLTQELVQTVVVSNIE